MNAIAQRLDRAAYKTQQWSIFGGLLLFQETARRLLGKKPPAVNAEVLREVQRRYMALLDRDLDNVAQGLYPRELLFQIPTAHYARQLPKLLLDAPRIRKRMQAGDYRDLPEDAVPRNYPPYYRRTFHWQSDGYLSDHSAELYDVGVEFLFRGTADIMRRQVIPPVSRFVAGSDPRSLRLIDVACGTGRTLLQMATAHPRLRYVGVDLSPYYVRAARQLLRDVEDLSLVAENAESLPFSDGYADIVTSVYMFHEMPINARRNALAEMYRVLRPGGLLVLEDSAQLSDSGFLEGVLRAFPQDFHEPFYDNYLENCLTELTRGAGFQIESSEVHLVSKVVVARKPAH